MIEILVVIIFNILFGYLICKSVDDNFVVYLCGFGAFGWSLAILDLFDWINKKHKFNLKYFYYFLKCRNGYCDFYKKEIKTINDCKVCSVCNLLFKCSHFNTNN